MRLISPKEYARKKGLHFATVYKKIKDGVIPHEVVEKTTNFIRIPWDDTLNEAVKAN